MRREAKAAKAPKRRPDCYERQPGHFWNPVDFNAGCRNCPFRMSCQNPAATGDLLPAAFIDESDY